MNATENALLFKCGSKGYINQTYTPTEIYNCGVAEGNKTAKEKNPTYSIFMIHFSLGSLLKVLKRLHVVRMASQMRVMWQATFMHVVFCKGKVQKPMREYIIQGLLILSPNLSYCSC
ncbi:BFH_collapsed_G0006550.mRNA.1.CDS.1 [Saccharomyces cerevisiae]|nr:BFH_HP2_G0006190.mRNA.1.CDS.1 [Saccharomyces cerevisiae]CAI6411581.1 BFH_HP2_G0006190.mRNA.1.CDS.1 [Saccharomyces cerevisiae]CAI6415550.1 BFH_HP1_G0006390.mRNA.1.CDS.1 [Saccharomyces cerevisiae]CAI7059253.1 BFH_collapsed_G0006550.mRNA.1.CDS.1 [Saccharomyces cerevisiae]